MCVVPSAQNYSTMDGNSLSRLELGEIEYKEDDDEVVFMRLPDSFSEKMKKKKNTPLSPTGRVPDKELSCKSQSISNNADAEYSEYSPIKEFPLTEALTDIVYECERLHCMPRAVKSAPSTPSMGANESFLKFQISLLETRCDELQDDLKKCRIIESEADTQDVSGLIEILEEYEKEMGVQEHRITSLEYELRTEISRNVQLDQHNSLLVSDLEKTCVELATIKYDLANRKSEDDIVVALLEDQAFKYNMSVNKSNLVDAEKKRSYFNNSVFSMAKEFLNTPRNANESFN